MAKLSVIRYVSGCVLFLCVILFQMQNLNCQRELYPSGMLSFCINVPRTLVTTHIIKITGVISQSSSGRVTPAPWLNVILSSECSSSKSPFYLRMQVNNGTTITGNSFENGSWGKEISGERLTLSPTGQFVLLVAIQSDGYKVTAIGVPLWTLPHRMSYTDVKKLTVRGASISIRKIELIDQSDPDQQWNTEIFYPVPLEKPVSNPTFPFWGYIPGGLQVDKAILIKGYFPENVQARDRTNIDLCRDRFENSITLHVDIRFKFNMDIRRVVRNYQSNGIWPPTTEERDGPFPFNIGEEFIMLIEVQPKYYNISVNGIPCWTFNHRLPFGDVNQVVIGGSTMDILEIAYVDTSDKEEVGKNIKSGSPIVRMVAYASQVHKIGIFIALSAFLNHCLQMI